MDWFQKLCKLVFFLIVGFVVFRVLIFGLYYFVVVKQLR